MNEELKSFSLMRSRLFKDPLGVFGDIPQLVDTRYRSDKYCPIKTSQFQDKEGYMAFLGVSYLYHDGKLIEPKVVCVSHSAKAVEFYMFGCRQYFCIRSLLNDKEYEIPSDSKLSYHGAGIIYAATFDSEDDFLQYCIDNDLQDYLMTVWKYLNKELCGYLPDNKKSHIPLIVAKLIEREMRSSESYLKNLWDDMRHLFYYLNIAHRYPHSSMRLTEPVDEGASTIWDACQYIENLVPPQVDDEMPFPKRTRSTEYEKRHMNYKLYTKLILGSNPIFFMNEREYRMRLKCEKELDQMDKAYRDKIALYTGNWP